jgi:hypothetical protein
MAVESVDVTPRRWTVGAPSLDWPPAYSPAVERVAVREDRITENDVQAVASELALADGYNPNGYSITEWTVNRDAYEAKARRILAVVLGCE